MIVKSIKNGGNIMWDPIPDKYITKCTLKGTDEIIFDRVYEAISSNEAKARAYLNCVNENNHSTNIKIEVKRFQ
jgi:hypothetical protein